MADDYNILYQPEVSKDLVLHDIEEFLNRENASLHQFNLSLPRCLDLFIPNLDFNNAIEMKRIAD